MGETCFRVGETIRYELHGKLSPAVAAKDAFLQIAGQYGDHANQNVEHGGPGLASLSLGFLQDAHDNVGRAVGRVRGV